MSPLNGRLRALERLQIRDNAAALVIRWVGAEKLPLQTLSADGQTWNRLPDESEDAFVDRVAELVPVAPNCARMLFGQG